MTVNSSVLMQIIECLNYGVIVCNKSGDFELWNKKAEKIIAIKENVITSDLWTNYFNVFTTDGKELNVENYPIMKAIKGVSTIEERLFVKNVNLKDGVHISVDSFPIVDDSEKVIGAVVVFIDITERIKMEHLFAELSERFKRLRELLEKAIILT